MTHLPDLPLNIETVKGFLDLAEAETLMRWVGEQASQGPCLEIGSYCGKSAVYLGTICKAVGGILFALDHHRGSEENQPGWEYHDAELWDNEADAMDTLPVFRRNMHRAGLEDTVIPIVGKSHIVSAVWQTPLSFLFIDGGHTMEHAMNDYRGWAPHLKRGGILAIHDVFPDPADGGRPPFEMYQRALASDLYEEIEACKSLRILRKL